ncbi:MAG: DUF4116 domain-containing protein [Patescibacteria group bacterium]
MTICYICKFQIKEEAQSLSCSPDLRFHFKCYASTVNFDHPWKCPLCDTTITDLKSYHPYKCQCGRDCERDFPEKCKGDHISKYFNLLDFRTQIDLMSKNGFIINLIENKSIEFFKKLSVRSSFFEYIRDTDDQVYFNLAEASGRNLEYVPIWLRTPEICMRAVKDYGMALNSVPTELKTYEICLEAVKNYGKALRDVPMEFRTYEVCSEAYKSDQHSALKYGDHEMMRAICKENGHLFIII